MEAFKAGLGNLEKHIENIAKFDLPCVVAINAFPTDTEAELQYLMNVARSLVFEVAISKVWEKGADGGIELAEKLLNILETKEANYHPLYDLDLSIEEKIETIVKKSMVEMVLILQRKQKNKIKKIYRTRIKSITNLCCKKHNTHYRIKHPYLSTNRIYSKNQ